MPSNRGLAAVLLGLGFFAPAIFAQPASQPAVAPTGAATVSSDEKLRLFMQQVKPQPDAAKAGSQAVRDAQSVSPERLAQRAELLKQGELLLSQRNTETALATFERAALILHAADSEMGIVRSYMQTGEYRRALAFGAHTAGSHLDVVGGSALYAWLLYAGGQTSVAQRLLAEAKARSASSPLIAAASEQLASGAPLAGSALLALPTRLAPYGDDKGLPKSVKVVGSASLLPGGTTAVLPAALMPTGKERLWLRNGLGQMSSASLLKRLPDTALVQVKLASALPAPSDYALASRDAFAGSVGYAVEYVSSPAAGAAWPLLRSGFLGGQPNPSSPDSPWRGLGLDMPPGPRGGPVFDAAGQLTGIALPSSAWRGAGKTADLMVPASALKKALGTAASSAVPASPLPKAAIDQVYESALRSSLQVIR